MGLNTTRQFSVATDYISAVLPVIQNEGVEVEVVAFFGGTFHPAHRLSNYGDGLQGSRCLLSTNLCGSQDKSEKKNNAQDKCENISKQTNCITKTRASIYATTL